jgi:hypothetical protein
LPLFEGLLGEKGSDRHQVLPPEPPPARWALLWEALVHDHGAEAVAAVEGLEGVVGGLDAAERVRDVRVDLELAAQVPASHGGRSA